MYATLVHIDPPVVYYISCGPNTVLSYQLRGPTAVQYTDIKTYSALEEHWVFIGPLLFLCNISQLSFTNK